MVEAEHENGEGETTWSKEEKGMLGNL